MTKLNIIYITQLVYFALLLIIQIIVACKGESGSLAYFEYLYSLPFFTVMYLVGCFFVKKRRFVRVVSEVLFYIVLSFYGWRYIEGIDRYEAYVNKYGIQGVSYSFSSISCILPDYLFFGYSILILFIITRVINKIIVQY